MTKKKTTQPTEILPLLQLLGDEMAVNPPSQPQSAVARRDKVDNRSATSKPPTTATNQAETPAKSRLTARRAPIKASVELFG